MNLKRSLIWTALPAAVVGPLKPGATLRLAVHIAPRLWTDPPTDAPHTLNEFPDFLNWPAKLQHASFSVQFSNGLTLPAKVDTANLRSDLWQALFPADTPVFPYYRSDHDLDGWVNTPIISYPAGEIEQGIAGIYVRQAGPDLPDPEFFFEDPGLRQLAGKPVPPPKIGAATPGYVPGEKQKSRPFRNPNKPAPVITLPGKKKGCGCCVFSLLFLVLILLWRLLKGLASPVRFPNTLWGVLWAVKPAAGKRPQRTQGNPQAGGPQSVALQSFPTAAFAQLRDFVAPYDVSAAPTSDQMKADLDKKYDFHRMVAALGAYPLLQRRLGLVLELTITLGADLPPAKGTVQLVPSWKADEAKFDFCPRTHYILTDKLFRAAPQSEDHSRGGLLRLDDPNQFQVIQVDVAGAAVKLENTAINQINAGATDSSSPNGSPASLPALRTGGLSLTHPDLPKLIQDSILHTTALQCKLATLDGSPVGVSNPASLPPATDELWAEDLVRGYRIDVKDSLTGKWHSLNQRTGDYHFLKMAETDGHFKLADEGFIQLATTQQPASDPPPCRKVSPALITWTGWSLAAPRPGKTIGLDHPEDANPDASSQPADPANDALAAFQLEVNFTAVKGSLPRLRFGETYCLRARTVDLAGNSTFDPLDPAYAAEFANDQPEISPPSTYCRFEPLPPPVLALGNEVIEGGSLEHLVVRSTLDPEGPLPAVLKVDKPLARRHLAPPKGALGQAEAHYKLDTAPGGAIDPKAYPIALREAATLQKKVDANNPAGPLVPIPGWQPAPVNDDDNIQRIFPGQHLEVAYLPDPLTDRALLRLYEGIPGINQQPLQEFYIGFSGNWPDLAPFRLKVEAVLSGAITADWSETGAGDGPRLLTIQIPPAQTATLRMNTMPTDGSYENMGTWAWVEASKRPDKVKLKAETIKGRNWEIMPCRDLTLLHAVQRPLKIPAWTGLDTHNPQKQVGQTSNRITGSADINSASTARMDLLAEWRDPFDDLAKTGFDETKDVVPHQAHVAGMVVDQGQDNFNLALPLYTNPLTHDLGDTKFHQVTYQLSAASRFREYFPAATAGAPEKLVRPSQDELDHDAKSNILLPLRPTRAAFQSAEIYNSARPDGLRVAQILPTFAWENTSLPGERRHQRRGNGLRIYIERPWYSSGWGELLGVVYLADTPMHQLPDDMKPLVSAWGFDPTWQADLPAQTLTTASFKNYVAALSSLTLAERPNGEEVWAVGYPAVFEEKRGLWFADVELDPGGAYFPFVRLALARFQPKSVENAHLSRITRADFAQLLPDRLTTLKRLNPKTYEVRLSGPTYQTSDALQILDQNGVTDPNLRPGVEATLQRLLPSLASSATNDEALGWEDVANIRLHSGDNPGNYLGQINIDAELYNSRLRVVVREYEIYQSSDQQAPAGIMIMPLFLRRIAFLDTLDLPE